MRKVICEKSHCSEKSQNIFDEWLNGWMNEWMKNFINVSKLIYPRENPSTNAVIVQKS